MVEVSDERREASGASERASEPARSHVTSQSHVDYLASVRSQNDHKESCTPQM